jgi:transposase
MESAIHGKIQLFFMDASHFVMGGYVGIIWAKIRKYVRTGSGRARYNVLGALNFVTKELISVTNDQYITSTQVMELLHKISEKYHKDEKIKIILDNTKYQRCKAVTECAKELHIDLEFLPAYSPNLNLIERLWKFVKSQVLNCAYHNTFQEFKNDIDKCLNDLSGVYKDSIDTLIDEKVQLFDDVSTFDELVA